MTLPAATVTSKTMGEPTFTPTLLTEGHDSVLIGGLPAATLTKKAMIHTRTVLPFDSHEEMNVAGSSSVFIGGLPAVRMTDKLMFGDMIVEGVGTVLIG